MHALSHEIKAFSKHSLKKQCARVTTLSGRQIVETSDGSTVDIIDPQRGIGCGYVQDNSLDLQVGVVKPFLLLSSQDAAHDLSTLRTFQVSHILNVAYGVENAFPDLFVYKTVNILDVPESVITSYFHECSQFIDGAKAEGGVVLVHCNAGVSRSASVVVGYLMSRDGLSFEEAFANVKRARPSICPNPGFLQQLKSYIPQESIHT